MKSFNEILEENKQRKLTEAERKALVRDLSKNLRQPKNPDHVPELMALLEEYLDELVSKIDTKLSHMQVTIPEIKVPDITIPEIAAPDVTVNIPETKIPTPNVTVEPPIVNVEAPIIEVDKLLLALESVRRAVGNIKTAEIKTESVDLKPLLKAIQALERKLEPKADKKPTLDIKPITDGLRRLEKAIENMPVAVAGGGSGREYGEGETSQGLLIGKLAMAKDPDGNAQALSLDSDKYLKVNIAAGSTSGTEYTEGDTDTTITGNAIMWEDASDTLRAVSAAKPLPVDIQDSTVAVTQSGTWNITNVSGTISLPTGAATAAKQDSMITELQNIDAGKLEEATFTGRVGEVQASPTANTVLGRLKEIQDDANTLAGAVSGTEVQADIVAALPAGDNNIGNVDLASAIPAGTNYIGKTRLTDGTTDTDVRDLTNANALNVAIVDGSGDQITSFGGGTQYTEGDTDTTITGTALMWEDASDTLRPVSAGKPLPVDIQDSTIAVTQSGTWNITNVSGTVSLPTGAATSAKQDTQITAEQAIQTSVELIDDTVATLGTTTYTETTTKGLTIGAVRRDADTTLVGTTNEIGPLQMDANGRLKVEAFSGETLPVSLASVPSHAVTNAGTFAVQESGSALTALQKIDDPVLVDDAAFTPAVSSVMMAGFEYDDTTPDSVNEGDAGAARMSANRNIYTQIRDAAGNERGVNVTAGNALTVDGSAVTQPISAASLPLPSGAATAANQSTEITSLQLLDDTIIADNAGFTDGTTKVNMAGFIYDETAGTALTENDAAAARIDAKRAQIGTIEDGATRGRYATVTAANALKVDGSAVAQPVTDNGGSLTVDFGTATSGGYSIYTNIDLDPTGVNPKGSAGQIYGWYISNASAVTVYVKVYNKATAPTGSDTPVMTLPLYAGQTANMSFPHGIAFGTGIGLRATTGVATADTGDPGANAVICNILYA